MSVMPDSVALALPEGWEDIPLGESERRQFVEQQLDGLKEAGFDDRADLRQIELLAELGFQLADSARVMMASSLLAILEASGEDQDSEDQDSEVLTANLVVSGFLREDFNTDIPLRAELMAESYSRRAPSDDQKARYDFVEPPSVCEIGGLKAAKLVRLMSLPPERGADIKQFTQTYLVSVAEGDAVIVLQFTTMNFELAREFSELFETIAQTLRVLYPDDPTFLDEDEDADPAPDSGPLGVAD